MGRVTFQDSEVRRRIGETMCATWKNVHPGYHVEHLEGERFEAIKKIPNGMASENVVTLIATAEGELLHVIPGHWKPKDYIREIDFALSVAKRVEQADGPEARRKAVADRHRERLAEIEGSWDGGELGRRTIRMAHQRMIQEPLRAASEVRGVTDYALETKSPKGIQK